MMDVMWSPFRTTEVTPGCSESMPMARIWLRLTSGTSDGEPSCSPDGKWVIFQSKRSGTVTLWKVSIDGGEQTQLTTEETQYPAVSPDGKWIACLYQDEKARHFAGRWRQARQDLRVEGDNDKHKMDARRTELDLCGR